MLGKYRPIAYAVGSETHMQQRSMQKATDSLTTCREKCMLEVRESSSLPTAATADMSGRCMSMRTYRVTPGIIPRPTETALLS